MCKCFFVIFGLLALASYGSCQSGGLNVTSLKDWKPPAGMYKSFPYYIPGFDQEGRPIFLWELGKCDFQGMMSGGREKAEIMDKYMTQTAQNIIALGKMFEDDGGITIIVDMEGFSYTQVAHIPTALLFGRTAVYGSYIDPILEKAYMINVAFAAQQAWNLFVPIIGKVGAKAEFLGTNKERWMPVLLAAISKSQLPPWYGGSEDWKPLQVLGKGEPIDQKLLIEARKQQRHLSS